MNQRESTGMKDAASVVETLRQHGFQAYSRGRMCARSFAGREPKDYDVATDATPSQVMDIFPQTYAVGAQFGVVLVPPDEVQEKCRRRIPGKCRGSRDLPQRHRVLGWATS